ncbi:hypothetical protein [Haloactinomyces albus]|uniref:Uncharacterized protein n=1 Tax=Haloactinomyces albus TaxID=1352928 RepID=A0AAE3ZEA2_9ACTN|nr:hypothetical protein [Haloactinomyces albus]MDR7301969.1 hypothetical protein [Haloactinomyces albus]
MSANSGTLPVLQASRNAGSRAMRMWNRVHVDLLARYRREGDVGELVTTAAVVGAVLATAVRTRAGGGCGSEPQGARRTLQRVRTLLSSYHSNRESAEKLVRDAVRLASLVAVLAGHDRHARSPDATSERGA